MAYGVETTLVSYTVPVGRTFKVKTVVVSGDADGEFALYIDTEKVMIVRNNPAERTVQIDNLEDVQATAGEIVYIKAENVSHRQNSQKFDATLTGGYT